MSKSQAIDIYLSDVTLTGEDAEEGTEILLNNPVTIRRSEFEDLKEGDPYYEHLKLLDDLSSEKDRKHIETFLENSIYDLLRFERELSEWKLVDFKVDWRTSNIRHFEDGKKVKES